MQQQPIYILQYVNLEDGRTFFHYTEYPSMDDLIESVTINYRTDWTSYEVIVVRR